MGRIIKLSFLIFIKEIYLLLVNLLGLIFHPFLTLNRIFNKKDFSQISLIVFALSGPLIFAFSFSAIYLVLKYFFNIPLPSILGSGLKYLDSLALSFSLFALSYLFYWFIKVIKTNHVR
ncbi:MAG: hypothetical protein ABIB61_00870 [Candidatus Shapirobacteria bacterium]